MSAVHPKISEVTVVYNAVHTIEQTIVSVLDQTYPNVEYIIIDGGSTDGTVDIIRKYEDRLAYWCSEKDNGIYDAVNKGAEKATGDYVHFLNADDCLYRKDTLEQVAALLDESVDVFSGAVITIDEETLLESYVGNKHARVRASFAGGMIPTQGILYRTGILRQYTIPKDYKVAADYDHFLSLYYNSKIKFLFSDLIVAYYGLGGVSSVTRYDDELFRIYDKYGLEHLKLKLKKERSFSRRMRQSFREKRNIILKKLHLWATYRALRSKDPYSGKKHSCDNHICRWCGRLPIENPHKSEER
jgi:family 2 glycosyltransferase